MTNDAQQAHEEQTDTSAERFIALGRALQALKDGSPHGSFGPLLADLGLDRGRASRAMACASRLGRHKRLIAAAGSASKLIEFLALDDDVLEALEKTGRLG
eukprot:TRINITY_DN9275_c0_g1_i2.p1 TRINITY_DN9275_c0_g1~~TRINITY_DN9275_c0_g1_i2.p1  ORF type:complete len:101 (+),score=12.63 TRINITY_DN9275_c0_g1_i2:159-461(+)